MYWLVFLMAAQLAYSSTLTVLLNYREYRLHPDRKHAVAGGLQSTSYWAKSALIAAAVVYGPEKYHWQVGYATLAIIFYLIGDAGLYLLWRNGAAEKLR